MIDHKASSRYAKALFEFAISRNETQAVDQGFVIVLGLLDKHPEISHLVFHSTISKAEKEDFLEKILGDQVPKTLVSFLKLLIRKKRFAEVRSIQSHFHKQVEKKRGIQEVEVHSAVALSAAAVQKLTGVLKSLLRLEIRLLPEVHPEMIGGLILRFDGKEINYSFKSRLAEIRQKITA